jgi:hypothetical protein
MFKLIITPALLAIALAIVGCTSGGGIPDSSISLLDADNGDQIISTVNTTGDITLHVGEVMHFKVQRLQSSSDDTETSDVTTVATYVFVPEDIAVANSLGELRALSAGTTRMEARFRPDQFASADRVYLDITVVP